MSRAIGPRPIRRIKQGRVIRPELGGLEGSAPAGAIVVS